MFLGLCPHFNPVALGAKMGVTNFSTFLVTLLVITSVTKLTLNDSWVEGKYREVTRFTLFDFVTGGVDADFTEKGPALAKVAFSDMSRTFVNLSLEHTVVVVETNLLQVVKAKHFRIPYFQNKAQLVYCAEIYSIMLL